MRTTRRSLRSTEAARRAWLTPLATWLVGEWGLDSGPARILDVGCGDLALTALVPAAVVVDGVDVDPVARAAARDRLAAAGRGGRVEADLADLGSTTYRGVVLSSVLQYLPDDDAAADLVATAAGRLAEGGSIVVTDVVGPDRRRWRDAADTWGHLRAEVGVGRAVVALAVAVLVTGDRHRALDLDALAAAAGLRVRQIEPNLSPLATRRSAVLSRPEATPGPSAMLAP